MPWDKTIEKAKRRPGKKKKKRIGNDLRVLRKRETEKIDHGNEDE